MTGDPLTPPLTPTLTLSRGCNLGDQCAVTAGCESNWDCLGNPLAVVGLSQTRSCCLFPELAGGRVNLMEVPPTMLPSSHRLGTDVTSGRWWKESEGSSHAKTLLKDREL